MKKKFDYKKLNFISDISTMIKHLLKKEISFHILSVFKIPQEMKNK